MPATVSVTFAPSGAAITVASGTPLLHAARAAGVVIAAPCGGRGVCGLCAVRVLEGALLDPGEHEAAALKRMRQSESTVRLACRALVGECDVTVAPLVRPGGAGVAYGIAPSARGVLGVAVDLGTTTVSTRLIDVGSGTVLSDGYAENSQVSWGADLVTRIGAALSGEGPALAAAARDSIGSAVDEAIGHAGTRGAEIGRMLIAANPVMAALLVGADVSGLAAHPFVPVPVERGSGELAAALGVREVRLIPAVDAFVGGDLVAGIIGSGLAEGADGTLYVDIGTNAEVALVLPDVTYVTSAPAGSAFEGSGIACGGGAGRGGVTQVVIDGERIVLESGRTPATHLTGSGVLSALSALRRAGQLAPDGTLLAGGPLAARLFEHSGIRAIALGEDPGDASLFLTQLDVRAVQTAKAAITAAIAGVRAAAGESARVREVIVAGMFGGAIDSSDLTELGVVPRGTDVHVRVVSDAVVSGTAALLVSDEVRGSASRFIRTAVHVDLAADEGFSAMFLSALRLEPYSLGMS